MGKRRVILYGKSVILGTVGASLGRYPQLEVVSLSPPFPTAQELEAMAPVAILFDLEAARPEGVFSLLETCPGLLLVGVNPDTNEALMWTGQQLHELSTQGLVDVITGGEAQNTVDISRESPPAEPASG